jgi:hypothetical protein
MKIKGNFKTFSWVISQNLENGSYIVFHCKGTVIGFESHRCFGLVDVTWADEILP